VENIESRPLSMRELLARCLAIYRTHFLVLAGIFVLPYIVAIPYTSVSVMQNSGRFPWMFTSAGAKVTSVVIYLGFGVYLMTRVAAWGAMINAVSYAYLGQRLTIRASYRKVRGTFWRLIGLTGNVFIRGALLFFAIIFIGGAIVMWGVVLTKFRLYSGASGTSWSGFVIFMTVVTIAADVAGWIWLLFRLGISLAAMVIENIGIRAALKRSVILSRGRQGYLFVIALLGLALSIIGESLGYEPLSLAARLHAMGWTWSTWMLLVGIYVGAAIGAIVAGPLWVIALVITYYDLRVRKEGLDLQLTTNLLSNPIQQDSTSPALKPL
jgi:hypothetical protein